MRPQTTELPKNLKDKNGNYTFFAVYGPTGFVTECLTLDRAQDALDDTFKEHRKIHSTKWSEGKSTPAYRGYIVKRVGHVETVVPYQPYDRNDRDTEEEYEDFVN